MVVYLSMPLLGNTKSITDKYIKTPIQLRSAPEVLNIIKDGYQSSLSVEQNENKSSIECVIDLICVRDIFIVKSWRRINLALL